MEKRSRFSKNLRYQNEQLGITTIEVCVDTYGTWTERERTQVLSDTAELFREAQERLEEMMIADKSQEKILPRSNGAGCGLEAILHFPL